MADDLDDMLLAVAGRTKGGSSNDVKHSSNRRAVQTTRDSSSEDDEDDDEDEDDMSRKEKGGSRMPLKKRFDSGDRDTADDREGDGYGSDISFGSDLYKDDEDRRKLEAMTELEREMILHERSEQRDNYKMRKRAEARIAEQQRQRDRRDGPPSSRMRSSGRETSKSVKTTALNELVARRKAQDTDQQRKRRDMAAADVSRSKENRKAHSTSPSSHSEADSEEEESSRESNRSEGLPSDDDDDERGGGGYLPDNNEIRSITIRRSKLFKWFMEPFFEDVIIGCFVRIGIGVSNSGASIYRLCLVKNVDAKDTAKQYTFENRTTYKYLNCTWGDDTTAARWQMVRASDQLPTDDEIEAWKAEAIKSGSPGITKEDVRDKQDALEKVNSYVYSAAAVKQMLQEKKMAAARPSNAALEKDRLMKELSVAESKGDQEQIERLQERLKEIQTSKQKTKNEKAERIEMMNRRNRFENFKNASEVKPVNAKMGEAGYDPFSRRWTRSQNYYKSDVPKTAAGENGASLLEKASADPTALENSTKQGKARLPGDQHSKMFNLHDFDLPISLAPIERFKGAQGAPLAFMERKRTVEARYGVQVESNDGRRHSLTLTVNDYKRRRGLL